jgi:hypothetical protein
MQIRLSDEDRERFGCVELLDLDPTKLTVVEASEIKRCFGVTATAWAKALYASAKAAKANDGQDVANPVGRDGQPVDDDDLVRCYVWMALRRSGVKTPPLDELDFDFLGFAWVNEPGKDQETSTETSEPGGPSSA